MIKLFLAGAVAMMLAIIGADVVFITAEPTEAIVPVRHPEPQLFKRHMKRFEPHVNAKIPVKMDLPPFGTKIGGCNRIPVGGGRCDALQYYRAEPLPELNGIVNRDL